jgi:sugar/nucleoside kinase (ribokinase family)
MSDVLCLGEILVDWVCTSVGSELPDAVQFTKAPGGAPANTAVGLARQGIETGFIGRVSKDAFGEWLKAVLRDNNIDVSGTIEDSQAQTRMAYVVTMSNGDRKLAEFSRIACADTRLQSEDLDAKQFARASILHFGSISLIEEPAKSSTEKAVALAKENGMLASYDPNVRLSLWPSESACRDAILKTLHWGDIVKINEDELKFLTGSRDHEEADKLRRENNIGLMIVTLDSRGAYISTAHGSKIVPGFSVKLVEATGAGDGFNAGVLGGLLAHVKSVKDRRAALDALSLEVILEIIHRANAIGALACTRPGAIPALPTKAELDAFLSQQTVKS